MNWSKKKNTLFKTSQYIPFHERIDIIIGSLYEEGIRFTFPISGMYFGPKNSVILEERFRKIESLIDEIKNSITLDFLDLSDENQLIITYLFREVLTKYADEMQSIKRDVYKKYIIEVFNNGEKIDEKFEDSVLYLNLIDKLSFLDIKILREVQANDTLQSKDVVMYYNEQNASKKNIDKFAILSAFESLLSLGLVTSIQEHMTQKNPELEYIKNCEVMISSYGKKFVEYCIENNEM